MTEINSNELIESIASNNELSTANKLFMFVSLCDEKTLIQHMQKTAMMARIGMVVPSPVDAFAYGVMRIAKPHLFESADEDRRTP